MCNQIVCLNTNIILCFFLYKLYVPNLYNIFQMNSITLRVLLLCMFAISIAAGGWWIGGKVEVLGVEIEGGFLFKSRGKRDSAVSVDS